MSETFRSVILLRIAYLGCPKAGLRPQNDSIWYQVLGTKYLVPSIWYQVFGTKYLVPNTWYQVFGTKYLVPNTWYQILDTKYLVPHIVKILSKYQVTFLPWIRSPSELQTPFDHFYIQNFVARLFVILKNHINTNIQAIITRMYHFRCFDMIGCPRKS